MILVIPLLFLLYTSQNKVVKLFDKLCLLFIGIDYIFCYGWKQKEWKSFYIGLFHPGYISPFHKVFLLVF